MKRSGAAIVFFLSVMLSFNITAQDPTPKTTGKVSHEFKGSCGTVVIIEPASGGPVVLIPKTALPKALDKNGTLITFNYKKLRMPNPKGCGHGTPAELTDVQKK